MSTTSTADAVRPSVEPLLDVDDLAAWLTCSPRHIYRMTDAGKLPAPIRLGALVRWRRADIENWLAAGCPSIRGARR